jgi:hypothetical protein
MADKDRFISVSHRYAQQVITEYSAIFPRGHLQGDQFQDRTSRIKFLLFLRCQTILKRSKVLQGLFDRMVSSVRDREEYVEIVRRYERDWLEKIEVEGSIGWNYLHDDNWDLIEREIRRSVTKEAALVRTLFQIPAD